MELSTEEKILNAAKEVFTKKGFAATRMQEIADVADINKGLLHYYFRSKNQLFRAVFDEAFDQFALLINKVFAADMPLFEKIEAFVNQYMDILIDNPALPSFVINELNQKGDAFVQDLMSRKNKPNPLPLIGQVQMEVQAGRIRAVNPFHLVLNMLSMCAFPFIARPLFQGIAQVDDPTYLKLMENRKQEIIDFIHSAIRV
ncbi:MAG: TetR family transcriptional regulator [Lewinellaceae bacterium]|nr:TetR family transcriptional regulator [Phaeodactylibacter sp.]MCB0612547.1 TetR family transcriptional regulator [Phaeodactylibacter sp.]MCB9347790.1 TetR family transcriptional regulator [Lewinellaceae bacterium]